MGVLGGVESRRSSPKSAAVGARARERERRAGERGNRLLYRACWARQGAVPSLPQRSNGLAQETTKSPYQQPSSSPDAR